MPKPGRRYPLVLYTRMMDRWWPPMFLIGLATLALAWWIYSDLYARLTAPWKWMLLAGAGGLCLLASLLMLILRQAAYVRPYGDHVRIVTPLLQMRISYKRIRHTRTATMATLFPIRKMGILKRDTIGPLLPMTAVILELNALPMPRSLQLFEKRFCRPETRKDALYGYNQSAFLKLVGPGFFVAIPTVYKILAEKNMPWYIKILLNLRLCVSGAAPLPVKVIHDFEKASAPSR